MGLERYLRQLRRIRRGEAGTPENSYVPTLVEYLREVLTGVEVVPWPRGQGVGLPDIGLQSRGEVVGLMEAEALDVPLDGNASGWEQARRYATQAPTALTNFREFVLVTDAGEVRRYVLSSEELLNESPRGVAARHETRLAAFLRDWASRRGRIFSPQALATKPGQLHLHEKDIKPWQKKMWCVLLAGRPLHRAHCGEARDNWGSCRRLGRRGDEPPL